MLRSSVWFLALLAPFSLAAADFQFDATGVTATATPFATTYWICTCFGSFSGTPTIANHHAIISDTDGDGVVRWDLGDRMRPSGLWTMIDGSAGLVTTHQHFNTTSSRPLAPSPFPPKALLRDENGDHSRFVLNSLAGFGSELAGLWVRPGVGAWRGGLIDDNARDEIHLTPMKLMYAVGGMLPVDGSPAAPAGVRAGDFFVLHDDDGDFWAGGRVDQHLNEAVGGGVIVFASAGGDERSGKRTITLARIEGTDGAASVHYATSDLTGIAGVHYQATSGTLVFEPGRILRSFDVPLIDDTAYAQATFRVTLSDPSGATIGKPSIDLSIADNDGTPTVFVERVLSVPEGDGGPRELPVRMMLSHEAPKPVRAEWQSADFFTGAVIETGVVEFAVGEKERSLVLHYIADDLHGVNKRFRIDITRAVNATPTGFGHVVIVDDDPAPLMTIPDVAVSEGVGSADVTVRIGAPLANDYTFRYATQDATASAPDDYTATHGELVIPTGSTSATISVRIREDTRSEDAESFRVVITGGLNGPEPLVGTVTILDDDGRRDPTVTIEHVTISEGDGGPTEAPVKATLSEDAARPVTLEWKAYDLATSATVDTGVLQFATVQRVGSLYVGYVADDVRGADRQLGIVITKATNASASTEGRLTILDDDAQGRRRAMRH